MTTIDVDIKLDTNGKNYMATVSDLHASGKRSDIFRWKISRKDNFPNKATVILQFVGNGKSAINGPFDDAEQSLGRYETTGNNLIGLVSTCASGPFSYSLSWVDGGAEKVLLDPEIVIDGDAAPLTKFKQSLRAVLKQLRKAGHANGRGSAKSKKQGSKAKKR
jgi:hypothetical protein